MKKHLVKKRRKNFLKRRGSQGMTAAIILIAFIITAAGIAFVILTMGSEMQIELGHVGDEGRDSASSAMQIEGNVITGYTNSTPAVEGIAFNVRLVLATGQVDLSSDAITVWYSINHSEETECTYDAAVTTLSDAANSTNANKYGIVWYDGSGDVLTQNEMARFLIGCYGNGANEGEEIFIVINSEVATMKIELTVPVGLTASGSNLM
ncbi:MAG: hypothetical protein ACTSWL_01270 [Promethearchaeota archaeon]